jgi:Skp family chaperone for outer membrane proteins
MKLIHSIAILGITSLSLVACGGKDKNKETAEPNVPIVRTDGLKIAYYSQDSITAGFAYYLEMDSIIKKKQISFQNELGKREKALRDFLMTNDERDRRGELSMAQKQAIMEQAQRKEQDLMQYQQSRGMELERESGDILEVISNKIEGAGKKFCEKNGIDILLIHGKGGQLNYVNKSMDVTKEFLEFLNAYEDEIQADMGKDKKKK